MKVIGVGFGSAFGVENCDSLCFESEQGEAHSHAVIVISLNAGGLWDSGVDGESIGVFFGVDPGTVKFCDDGGDAVSFFVSHMSDVANACG